MTDFAPPAPPAPEPAQDTTPAPEPFDVGAVVFYEVAEYGESEPVTHAGLVVHASGGRVRVKDLGAAVASADFPAAAVRGEA